MSGADKGIGPVVSAYSAWLKHVPEGGILRAAAIAFSHLLNVAQNNAGPRVAGEKMKELSDALLPLGTTLSQEPFNVHSIDELEVIGVELLELREKQIELPELQELLATTENSLKERVAELARVQGELGREKDLNNTLRDQLKELPSLKAQLTALRARLVPSQLSAVLPVQAPAANPQEFTALRNKIVELERTKEQQADLLRQAAQEAAQAREKYDQLLQVCKPLASLMAPLAEMVALLPKNGHTVPLPPVVQPAPPVQTAPEIKLPIVSAKPEPSEESPFCGMAGQVQEAIAVWTAWLAEIGDQNAELQEQIEEIGARLSTNKERARFGGESDNQADLTELKRLRSEQMELTQLETTYRPKLDKLYRIAGTIDIIKAGLDNELLHPPEIEIKEEADTKPGNDEQEEIPFQFSSDAEASVRYCHEQAAQQKMEINAILIATLFDVLPKVNGKTQHRGTKRMVTVAVSVGMLRRFKIRSHKEFYRGWNKQMTESNIPYLMENGKCKGNLTLKRTNLRLPWDPLRVFSEEEIRAFVAAIESKSEQAQEKTA